MDLMELKGTKDYSPEEQIIRERIQDVLKKTFEKYGFKPLETTILDFYEVGAKKGGDEILKEAYRLNDQGKRELILRYELTFKLAKYIGMNPNIRLPFKRYEIGRVFRDGPVKTGRLREFTQCDVDIVGIKETYADAEIIYLINDVFKELDLDVVIEVGSKKILFAIMEYCNIDETKFESVALTIDKIKKTERKEIIKELEDKEIDKLQIKKLFEIFDDVNKLKTNQNKIDYLENKLISPLAKESIKEVKEVFGYLNDENVYFSPSLSRGLGYYTGLFWETFLKDSKITSSLCGGGRWDKMIGLFLNSDEEYPATGIAFGLDVILAALKEKQKDKNILEGNLCLVGVVPINALKESFDIAQKIRNQGVGAIVIDKKISKALDYADKEEIPYILIVGKKELQENKFTFKNMKTGEEKKINIKDAGEIIK